MTRWNSSKIVPVFLILLLALQGCRKPRQNAEEVFASGHLPDELESIINPKPNQETSLEMASQETVNVAVIDQGVDYMHPKLFPQIRFDYKDGKIVGTGKDFYGSDHWPHPNIMDATVFSLGATISEDAKIVEPIRSPLSKLTQLNYQFLKIYKAKAQEHSKSLNQTLLTKVTPQSFHVLGALKVILMKKDLLKAYEAAGERDALIDWSFKDQSTWTNSQKREFESITPGDLRNLLDEDWVLDQGVGWPRMRSGPSAIALPYMKGFDAWVEIVTEAYDQFNQETQFQGQFFEPYFQYHWRMLKEPERPSDKKYYKMELVQKLYSTWFAATHSVELDRYYLLAESFCALLSNEEIKDLRSAQTPLQTKKNLVLSKITAYSTQMDDIHEWLLGTNLIDFTTQRSIRTELKQTKTYLPLVKELIEEKGYDLLFCDFKNYDTIRPYPNEEYEHQIMYTHHPYLADGGYSESHGTHVAGHIAAQDPRVRIVPVRVVTSSTQLGSEQKEELRNSIREDFQMWLEDPLVYHAVSHYLEKYLPEADLNPSQDPKDKFIQISTIMKIFDETFPSLAEKDPMKFQFFHQIQDSLIYVGSERIKLANISLGIDNEVFVATGVENREKDLDEKIEFLLFEYFKYRIGEVIQNQAPHTLFVVASGNDGQWLDGRARSTLPCDISSPFLKEAAHEIGVQPSPNNATQNVLCVGSVNKDKHLSSMTNLVRRYDQTRLRFPQVFTFGEAIPSYVNQYDCQGVSQQVVTSLGENPSQKGLSPKNMESYLVKNNQLDPHMDDEKKERLISRSSQKVATQSLIIRGLTGLLKEHACYSQSPQFRTARMTGTSMAAPGIAGVLAHQVAQYQEDIGLAGQDIYDHPDFTPAKIVDRLVHSIVPQENNDLVVDKIQMTKEAKLAW